jgi:hypothetical protein
MKRLVWINDIHMNFLSPNEIQTFLTSIAQQKADSILLGGDIGQGDDVVGHLRRLAERVGGPIYFVLGNHDFYGGSIRQVRFDVRELCKESKGLHWLSDEAAVELTPETALVGHDGWGDARCGDYQKSEVQLNDFSLIEELAGLTRDERLRRLRALGDEAGRHFAQCLPAATSKYRRVFVLTHVPPFPEACWHMGRRSDADYLPFFTCIAAGEELKNAAQAQPGCELTVLCGHTHGSGEVRILPNLQVITGGADYGRPGIQRVFKIV